jgi:hypothetical protein
MSVGSPHIHFPESGPSSRSQSPMSSPLSSGSNTDRALRRPASSSRLAQLIVSGRSRSSSTASQPEALSDNHPETVQGRSTPEQRRRNGKGEAYATLSGTNGLSALVFIAAVTSLLANDPKYRKFAVQVDKCLQSFDGVNEWADFISFLSRLLKVR